MSDQELRRHCVGFALRHGAALWGDRDTVSPIDILARLFRAQSRSARGPSDNGEPDQTAKGEGAGQQPSVALL